MAREGFIGSLGLVVLLCSVSRSTQQFIPDHTEIPVSRSGFLSESEDKSAAANALAQIGLGHPRPVTTTTWAPPPPPPPPPNGCVYPDQVIYERDIYDECIVCVCVQRPYGNLDRVCGRCDQCPPPRPPTPPPPPPPPPTTTQRPAPLPTCDPFPTNQPFQNPIDPCLICTCHQNNPFMRPFIDCVADPSCIIPPTTKPPGPPPPDPTVCDKYPHDVLFPHPLYPCFICKCVQWPYKPVQLECVPNPDCDPTTPRPPPPPPPPPPTTTTLAPPTPPPPPPSPWADPLPGPSPHPSCRPFIPDVIFQHPWDPCLDCVCTESHVVGITNVQITCFTKAECCIIPIDPTTPYYPIPTTTQYPIVKPPPRSMPGQISSSANANAMVIGGGGSVNMPGSPGGSLAQADAAAEAAAQAQAAADAVQANYVNQYPYIQSPQAGGAQAQAQALAQAQANQALAQALAEANAGAGRALPPSYYNQPNRVSPGGYGNANANANANAIVNSFLQQPSYYPGMGGGQAQADSNAQAGWGSANAQADASAQGNGQAQADAQAQSGYGPSGWSPIQDALAQAQANAQNSLYSIPQQAPMMPYGYGGLGSSAQAQAEAEADAGRGSAQAAANALAQELANQAQASAQANVNSQLYQSQPSPSLFNVPRGLVANPVDPPRYGGDAEAQAQAEASANSNRGVDASAQAQASASAGAQKSGDSDAGVLLDSQY